MKRFSRGDVVPGRTAGWVCSTEDEVPARVAVHARAEHGTTEIPAGVVASVHAYIVTVG